MIVDRMNTTQGLGALHLFSDITTPTAILLQIPPRLTVLEAPALRERCQQLCQQESHPPSLILDLGQTVFMDSSGVAALISALKTTKLAGMSLTLWSVQPPVRLVLELTRLDQVLQVDPLTAALLPTSTRQPSRLPQTHPSVKSKPKRLLDVLGSVVGLAFTALVFIPIAVAIKLDSPGPIFFSQTRYGWLGRPFRIWKFRSMVTNAEALKHEVSNEISGAFFKNAEDPRITRVGKFIRRTSLDEFPQFWNVLKGEMSLVGTRPPTQDEVDAYRIPEWQRFDVKPGITGEWQVKGRSRIQSFEEVVQMDLNYQQNWSLAYDLHLIWQTLSVVFTKRSGAV